MGINPGICSKNMANAKSMRVLFPIASHTGRVVFAGGVDDVRGNDALITQHLGVY